MQECTILLPTIAITTGDELVEVHTNFIEEIVRTFGNCRAALTTQFHRSTLNNKFTDIDAFEYKFAVPEDFTKDINQVLLELAKKYGKLCQTEHVYIVSALGAAQFVDIT